MFDDNRVRTDMLVELDKELLQELGVLLIGDIIAIIRQAKLHISAAFDVARKNDEESTHILSWKSQLPS